MEDLSGRKRKHEFDDDTTPRPSPYEPNRSNTIALLPPPHDFISTPFASYPQVAERHTLPSIRQLDLPQSPALPQKSIQPGQSIFFATNTTNNYNFEDSENCGDRPDCASPDQRDDAALTNHKVAGISSPAEAHAKLFLSDGDRHLVDILKTRPTGCGGSCEVYTALHLPTKRKLAMKRPKLLFPTDEVLRRFRREAEIWSTFEHVNILPFFGTMEIDYHLYLVSPWLALGDLLTFLKKRARHIEQGKLDLGSADESVRSLYAGFRESNTVREIAAGIGYLHSLNVVHGDIKATNVLLDDYGCAKICDFGLTKTPDHNVTSATLKGFGTIRWQSPELFHNSPKTSKSDVYAFGLTIAEVLTADYPFPHLKDPIAVIMTVVINNERPPFEPLARLGFAFASLWDLASKCWAPDAENRPSMEEILQILDQQTSQTSLLLSAQDAELIELGGEPLSPEGGLYGLCVGTHRPSGIKLAVKRPRPNQQSQSLPQLSERSGHWRKFDHAHILPIFGPIEIGGHSRLVSLWMELGDLLSFTQTRLTYIKEGKLGDSSVHPAHSRFNENIIAREVAAGIEYLHSHEFMHGNIKARNVLLDVDAHVKICDFNFSAPLERDGTTKALCDLKSVRWQGPELLHGKIQPGSLKSDVYAFGMTIAELLTGDCPLPHLKDIAFLDEVIAQELRPKFDPASRLGVEFEALWNLAARCWATSPDSRPTMKEVLQHLDPSSRIPHNGS